MPDTPDGAKQESPAKGSEKSVPKDEPAKIDSSVNVTPKTPVTPKILPEQSIFNVNISYENLELISFNVEKQDTKKIGTQNSSSSAPSSSETVSSPQKIQQEVKGTVALCTFIIDHFEKVGSLTKIQILTFFTQLFFFCFVHN